MSYIQFRLAARTDAAGKYNESAPLEGNEDNMFVDSDLANEVQGLFTADKVVDLSEKGCLMVVADGMGGMNAGEVASAIAIKTVMDYFAPARMSQMSFNNAQARIRYMEEVVVAADAAIKTDAQSNSEHDGMGSTIIMAWLCDGQVCITWCGDSRAYLFRPAVGFKQVSKDHSYVQGLVDEGKITEAEAFDHPYGNIITRSLGDPDKKAEPDSISFNVYEGDIIMLCSDGLSGVLRDHKTIINGERVDTENLEDLIRDNRDSMAGCRDELFAAAERNDWYDNVTAILCEIVKGDPLPVSQARSMNQASTEAPVTYAPMPDPSTTLSNNKRSKVLIPIIAAAAVLLLALAGFLVWKFAFDKPKGPKAEAKLFADCRKKNDVGLYRYYVEQYPKGDSVAAAKAWIKEWEKDSIAKHWAPAKPTDTQPEAVNSKTKEDMKAEKEKIAKAEAERKQEEQRKLEEQRRKEAEAKPQEKGPEGNGSVVKEKEFTKETDLKKISEEHPVDPNKLTPAGLSPETPNLTPGGLKQDKEKNNPEKTKKKSGEMTEEEAAYNRIKPKINNKTINLKDCEDYLHVYYKKHPQGNPNHWQEVAGKFRTLYTQKINHSSVDELEQIIIKHDEYVKSLNLNGMPEYDKQMKDLAIAKKKLLEKDKN